MAAGKRPRPHLGRPPPISKTRDRSHLLALWTASVGVHKPIGNSAPELRISEAVECGEEEICLNDISMSNRVSHPSADKHDTLDKSNLFRLAASKEASRFVAR